MTVTNRLYVAALSAALLFASATPVSAQFGASGVRPAIGLAGGAGTMGLGGRVGLGVSVDRFTVQTYMAGTLDGLVLAEGDSAQSAWVSGFMWKAELGPSEGSITGNVGLGIALGSKNQEVPITDADELERRLARGQSTNANVGFNEFYLPVEVGATYWLNNTFGVNAGGYVGVPLTGEAYTRRDTSEEVNPWQWAALVGVRIGRPNF
ncbi:hypothetical protein [Rubricoccus marinus]|uniref:Outer membrane protein beta-barrel domain-containing protein n=1 Tax=Rubricoccus marinus TaxID=716817 RepID=A0A259U2I4_9BACT|nr:hypothetical protein [Rubricoccus marinus]OZC04192.1 hypothetical protein BSZ36_15105 [Rubricoccus marinus]